MPGALQEQFIEVKKNLLPEEDKDNWYDLSYLESQFSGHAASEAISQEMSTEIQEKQKEILKRRKQINQQNKRKNLITN